MLLSLCVIGSEKPTPIWLKRILRNAVYANIIWPHPDIVVPRAVDHLRPGQVSILSHITAAHCAPSALSLFITDCCVTDISRNTHETQWPNFFCCDPAWPARDFICEINQDKCLINFDLGWPLTRTELEKRCRTKSEVWQPEISWTSNHGACAERPAYCMLG